MGRYKEDLRRTRHCWHLQGSGRNPVARSIRLCGVFLGVREAHAARDGQEGHPPRPGQPRERRPLWGCCWIRCECARGPILLTEDTDTARVALGGHLPHRHDQVPDADGRVLCC